MNQELEERRRTVTPPFDGILVATKAWQAASTLRRVLSSAVECLARSATVDDSPTGSPLVRVEGWHSHDGWISGGEYHGWADLRSVLVTDDALVASSSDDDFVWITWYLRDFSFLLQWSMSSDPENFDAPSAGWPRRGTWGGTWGGGAQIVGDEETTSEVREEWMALGVQCEFGSAADHFDQTYAG